MQDKKTIGEEVSDKITYFAGSWKFIFIFSIVLAIWILINTLTALNYIAFDKPPYILLNLLLSFVAAFQAPFIMMSQNRTERKQDIAYRFLFQELKELVQQDMEKEHDIERLTQEIKKNQEIAKIQYENLLNLVKRAIELQIISKQEIESILSQEDS